MPEHRNKCETPQYRISPDPPQSFPVDFHSAHRFSVGFTSGDKSLSFASWQRQPDLIYHAMTSMMPCIPTGPLDEKQTHVLTVPPPLGYFQHNYLSLNTKPTFSASWQNVLFMSHLTIERVSSLGSIEQTPGSYTVRCFLCFVRFSFSIPLT